MKTLHIARIASILVIATLVSVSLFSMNAAAANSTVTGIVTVNGIVNVTNDIKVNVDGTNYTVSSDGKYTVSLAPGRHKITAYISKWSSSTNVEILNQTIPETITRNINIETPGTVTGIILIDGAPPSSPIAAWIDETASGPADPLTGAFTFAEIMNGRVVTVTVYKNGRTAESAPITVKGMSSNSVGTLNIYLNCVVIGQVTSDGGNLDGATVTCNGQTAMTNGSGYYQFTLPTLESFNAQASMPGFFDDSVTFAVPHQASFIVPTIKLQGIAQSPTPVVSPTATVQPTITPGTNVTATPAIQPCVSPSISPVPTDEAATPTPATTPGTTTKATPGFGVFMAIIAIAGVALLSIYRKG